jgi:septum formation protein
MKRTLILASSSPRRSELLQQVNIPFNVRKQDVDEGLIQSPDPEEKAEQIAMLKARSTVISKQDEIILAADTVVALMGNIYGKPKDKEEAYAMLANLSGAVHEVYTGVTILSEQQEASFVEKTLVEFWPLTHQEIEAYLATNDSFDKAGAYGIQSFGATLVKKIIGDYYNVVGLPISRVVRELENFQIYPIIGNRTS